MDFRIFVDIPCWEKIKGTPLHWHDVLPGLSLGGIMQSRCSDPFSQVFGVTWTSPQPVPRTKRAHNHPETA